MILSSSAPPREEMGEKCAQAPERDFLMFASDFYQAISEVGLVIFTSSPEGSITKKPFDSA